MTEVVEGEGQLESLFGFGFARKIKEKWKGEEDEGQEDMASVVLGEELHRWLVYRSLFFACDRPLVFEKKNKIGYLGFLFFV